ncbi:LysR family transcriptional regulator [Sulfitobacter sp. M57]|nr:MULTISPECIES: LysR family transcriptional regulator [unclassified Sulfitobacter]MDF3459908.1 LysR family transcriptional regulator [Sulfitobacter sp. S74]MDF3479045.1 LysR family transcriptional regulator [Sulfitobacter sp. M53]MDF3482943.1 LysR family transcriptional regulator [Sulfitobacter sp. M24]MDF3415513.1 LysR family transcriptional regulator [Sulfitobacter sp. KE5]MDF3422994.1 LysR family transcriptional regulator [Sulfitobacter sp. KE43]
MIGHHLTLKQLEALVWVADLGSFRKAAHHLNTTQPNISARIASLESALGLPLMLRDAGSVRMTPRGTEVLAQARITLQDAARVIEIAGRPDLVDDRLRLGVTELVAATWLRPLMIRLKRAYPNVTVELTVDLSRNLDRELASNALDLTLQTAPFAAEVSGSIELGEYGYAWVAAPTLAQQLGRGTISQDDLVRHPILTHTRHTQAYLEVVGHFDAKSAAPIRIVPSNSLSAAMHMAMDGLGIAILPRALLAHHLTDGTLNEVPHLWHPSPLRVAARFHVERAAQFVQNAAQIAAECATDFTTGPSAG